MPIGAMARVDPVAGGARNQALLKRPEHEAQASVAAPERPIAIEDGHPGIAVENQPLELRAVHLGTSMCVGVNRASIRGENPPSYHSPSRWGDFAHEGLMTEP